MVHCMTTEMWCLCTYKTLSQIRGESCREQLSFVCKSGELINSFFYNFLFCMFLHCMASGLFSCRTGVQHSRGHRKSTHSRRQWNICHQGDWGWGRRTGRATSSGGQADRCKWWRSDREGNTARIKMEDMIDRFFRIYCCISILSPILLSTYNYLFMYYQLIHTNHIFLYKIIWKC